MRGWTPLVLLGLAAAVAGFGLMPDAVAVSTRLAYAALGTVAPDLEDPARIQRGAGHYAQFCVHCHASPAAPRRTMALSLAPPAPVLHLRVGAWPPERLFRTVRHGIPNTGMPGWPAPLREDEVWDMVAFLRQLPGLDAVAYRRITAEDVVVANAAPERACIRCHGPGGAGRDGIPRLNTQSVTYLETALHAFRDGARASGYMQVATAGLDDDALARLARHFARSEADQTATEAALERPAEGGDDGIVARCVACHGTNRPVRPDFPSLAGQDPRNLRAQLHLFRDHGEARGGGPFRRMMIEAARGLTDREISELAEWYAQQP